MWVLILTEHTKKIPKLWALSELEPIQELPSIVYEVLVQEEQRKAERFVMHLSKVGDSVQYINSNE